MFTLLDNVFYHLLLAVFNITRSSIYRVSDIYIYTLIIEIKRNIFHNQTISIMLSRVLLLLLTCHLSSSTTSMIKYNNAQFVPINATFEFAALSSINSWSQCVCQCLINSTCFTGTYFGINQSCSLFSIPLRLAWLEVVVTIMNATVFSITNRSLIGKSQLPFIY
jgi:hypothetical protein